MKKYGLLAVLCLSGCSLLSPVSAPPVTTYILNDPAQAQSIKPKSSKILLVTPINAVSWLNTNRMAYQKASDQINYFAQNQWVAAPNELLLPIVVHALENTGNYRAVISAPYAGNYDQQLDLTLLKMQQVFITKPSYYQMVLQARLIDNRTQQVLGTRQFELNVNAPSDNPAGGVIAANTALQTFLPQLVQFVHGYQNT